MTNLSQSEVGEGAYLTLHYRLKSGEQEVVSTFGGTPATLQMGAGQLAPALEQCLLGLEEGTQRSFQLAPGAVFGERNPELLQRVSKDMLREHGGGEDYNVGDVVEFAAPNGGRFAGVVRECGQNDALFDFNHPLAGQPIDFEVHIIGVL
jgi:FKBP-type peptidyl-prolyl cis-trans isomerase SlpA